MTSADLLALADRVERLTGPDREVAEEIALLMLSEHPFYKDRLRSAWDIRIAVTGWMAVDGDPTASLDAAMRLVPEGLVWDVTSTGTAWVDLTGRGEIVTAIAKSPALALTAACLRARASTDKGEA